ncbi:hypothetical protein ABGB07_23590 [Micromonosporaceae bacterium B7E4]
MIGSPHPSSGPKLAQLLRDGLFKQLTKTVLETVLNEEATGHLTTRTMNRVAAYGWRATYPLALCAEIEGVFVDLPPRPRERFALVGCTPECALADLLDRLPAEASGTDRAWLGDVSITAPAAPAGTPPCVSAARFRLE